MKSLSFAFRDYAVHLFPGSLVITSLLFLFLDFTWVTPSLAPLLVILFLFGGYISGFFLETITATFKLSKYIWKLSGGDPLNDYFRGVRIKTTPNTIKEKAAHILVRDFGELFIRKNNFSELLYLMMRDVEASNERSAAFVSRISSLENMAKNLGVACVWVATILVANIFVNYEQCLFSIFFAVFFAGMGALLFRRRTIYRTWLAKSVLRCFVALDRQSQIKKE